MRGFGNGIKGKLEAARARFAEDLDAEAATGDTGAASRELVLMNRRQLVHAEFNRRFPKLGNAPRARKFNAQAYRHGHSAGRSADLGDGKLGGTPRGELT